MRFGVIKNKLQTIEVITRSFCGLGGRHWGVTIVRDCTMGTIELGAELGDPKNVESEARNDRHAAE